MDLINLPAISEILQPFSAAITPDSIIRGQGADPELIRKRRPALVKAAESALSEGRSLIQPAILLRCIPVKEVRHGQILVDGGKIWGEDIFSALAGSEYIAVAAVTIGNKLEDRITEILKDDPVLAMGLDGLANSTVDWLSTWVFDYIEEEAVKQGFKVTLPYSPGMKNWSVDVGQPQIFQLLEPDPQVIRLNPSFSLIPRKSSTLIAGIGKNVEKSGKSPCQFCSMFEICNFKHDFSAH